MKYLIIFLCVHFSLTVFGQDWVQLANLPGTQRDDGTVFVINHRAYCGLGVNPWFGCEGSFYVFDLDAESWSAGTAMPAGEERQYANGFSHNGSGYVFGGIDADGVYLNDLWKFAPDNQNWTLQTPLPAGGRAGSVAFVIADTAYIVGGKSEANLALREVWGYDLVNRQWSQKSALPFNGIWRGVAFSWNGRGIIGSGKNDAGNLNTLFYTYAPTNDSWTAVTGLNPEPATYVSGAQIGKMAFLYGGMNGSGTYLNTFQRLDLETLQTTDLTIFPADARKGAMAFTGDNAFYLATGVSANGRLAETWKSHFILGLDENAPQNEVQVFPNPSEGMLYIRSAEPILKLQLSDVAGKIMLQETYASNEIELCTGFPPGIYFLEITGESSHTAMKIAIR